jgi:PAS domain S-box-containing protein
MMIGRTRLVLGPLRDLRHLDASIAAIREIDGVGGVAVDAFVDREAVLALQVLRPLDLQRELRRALGPCVASCEPGPGRLDVVLRDVAADAPGSGLGVPPHAGRAAGPGAVRPVDDLVADASPWDADATGWEEPAYDAEATVVGVPLQLARRRPDAARRAIAAGTGAVWGGAGPHPVPVDELVELSFVHAPVAKALISPDGRWLRVNRRLCELLGRDEEDLARHSLHEITHPDDVGADARLGREALAGLRDRYAVPKRFLHRDGRVVHARLEVSVVRDPDGRPGWFVFEVVELPDPGARRSRAALGVALA